MQNKFLVITFFYSWILLLLFQTYPKSILTFQKWTKKMSKNEKGRNTFEKT
jgi:hypothetical protein